MNRTATWLTIAACVLVALVPVGGLSLCFGDGLCDVGVGVSTGCPCGGHEDVPVEEHFDLSVDSVDGLRAESEQEPKLASWTAQAIAADAAPGQTPRTTTSLDAGSPPPRDEVGAIRAHRTVVLLI